MAMKLQLTTKSFRRKQADEKKRVAEEKARRREEVAARKAAEAAKRQEIKEELLKYSEKDNLKTE